MSASGATVRKRLSHPVIDADGHWLELPPVFEEYLQKIAGPNVRDRYLADAGRNFGSAWRAMSEEARARNRKRRPGWWLLPANTADRAAAIMPALFRERLDEWGIDVGLIYPTFGFTLGRFDSEEMRRALVRAYNTMTADIFRGYGDRLMPAGIVTLQTPKEAIDEAEHAVRELGFKLLMMNCTIPRTIDVDAEWQPDSRKRRVYIDCLAMDSPHNYDSFWAKCCELQVAVTNHTGSLGWPDRSSPTNFVADHIGHFAQSHHYFARGLFFGGVTQRFPRLNFAFLEGGVGWAVNLFHDIVGHWEKRNKTFMHERLKPDNLDTMALRGLFGMYGRSIVSPDQIDSVIARNLDCVEPGMTLAELTQRDIDSDDFRAVAIEAEEDIERLFTRNFYFGCEADDKLIAWAFDKRMSSNFKPILGSDISHFDVVDPAEVLEEAWELVEDRLITENDFRELCFANAVHLHGGMNPRFFEGTVVAEAAIRELNGTNAPHALEADKARVLEEAR